MFRVQGEDKGQTSSKHSMSKAEEMQYLHVQSVCGAVLQRGGTAPEWGVGGNISRSEGQVECQVSSKRLVSKDDLEGRLPAVLKAGLFGGAQRAVRTALTERWRKHEADGKREREREKEREKKREKKRERDGIYLKQHLTTEGMVCSVLVGGGGHCT